MKHIHFESPVIVGYPVGEHIEDAIGWIRDLSNLFIHYMHENGIEMKPMCVIWCRGSSGAILASLLANALKDYFYPIKIAHIKKKGEISHSSTSYMGFLESDFNIVIDDFISSGETLSEIILNSGKPENDKFDLLILNNKNNRCSDLSNHFKAFLYSRE